MKRTISDLCIQLNLCVLCFSFCLSGKGGCHGYSDGLFIISSKTIFELPILPGLRLSTPIAVERSDIMRGIPGLFLSGWLLLTLFVFFFHLITYYTSERMCTLTIDG